MKKTARKSPVSGAEMLAAMPRSPKDLFETNGGGLEFRVKGFIKLMKTKDEKVRLNALTTVSKMCADFPAERLQVSGLEETLQRLDSVELDKRIRLLDREAAALRTQMGEGSETVEP